MNKLSLLPAVFILLLGCTSLEKKQLVADKNLKGRVVGIIDGDTFDLLAKDNSKIRIRMNGIDCPERKQDYYQKAKEALSSFIFDKEIEVITFNKDRYQRIIGDVFLDGTNINLAMVTNGYAWHYKKYSSDLSLANAEIEARAAKRGLWEMPNPEAPWDFRHK